MNDAPAPLLVTFALPDESRDFVKLLVRPTRVSPRDHLSPILGELDGQRLVVLHTGVGGSATCRRRLSDLLATERPGLVVSAGYAGGLAPDLSVGDLILGKNHSDPALLAAAHSALRDETVQSGGLLTQTVVAETAPAKAALYRSSRALAVDMETAWIAAACSQVRLPLLALRVISDAAAQSFPVPGKVLFDTVRQRPRYVALPLWLLTHPGQILPFAAFVRGLPPARARLTRALRACCRALSGNGGPSSR